MKWIGILFLSAIVILPMSAVFMLLVAVDKPSTPTVGAITVFFGPGEVIMNSGLKDIQARKDSIRATYRDSQGNWHSIKANLNCDNPMVQIDGNDLPYFKTQSCDLDLGDNPGLHKLEMEFRTKPRETDEFRNFRLILYQSTS